MEYIRVFEVFELLKKKSVFLFGPRSVGKTYWIKKTLPENTAYLSLLSSETFLRLSNNPEQLKQIILPKKFAVIDEIQKMPSLLDEVHLLIEDEGINFLLTGSSARKLKRGATNMLGGRASNKSFFPLTTAEIKDFNLERYLTVGGLPRVYPSDDPILELDAYVSGYLELEVKAEALVRNLAPFSRFIKTAALSNGELINYANIANDAAVPASTVKEYFSILEDTLMGFTLEPWIESKKRKAIKTGKFYFFDPGVCNMLMGITKVERGTILWGKIFEQFIGMELKAYLNYKTKRKTLTFWRSENKQEVDFLIGEDIAIEVKSSYRISKKHLGGLRAIREENVFKKFYLISEDAIERIEDDIQIMHWEKFLKKLWRNEII